MEFKLSRPAWFAISNGLTAAALLTSTLVTRAQEEQRYPITLDCEGSRFALNLRLAESDISFLNSFDRSGVSIQDGRERRIIPFERGQLEQGLSFGNLIQEPNRLIRLQFVAGSNAEGSPLGDVINLTTPDCRPQTAQG
jgi:hypothetical protein